MSSAQSSLGAETSQHHAQYPSLQTALDFHQSSLLNTRNNSHYNRLISHPKTCSTISLQTGILILWPFINTIMIRSWAMLWWHPPSLFWQQRCPLAKIRQLLFLTILFQYVRKKRQRTFLCHYPNHKTLKCGWMFDCCLQMCLLCLALLASTHRQGNRIHRADSVISREWKERKMVSRGDLQFEVRCKAPMEYLIFFAFSGRCKDFCFWAAKSEKIWLAIKLITFWITVQSFILRSFRSPNPKNVMCVSYQTHAQEIMGVNTWHKLDQAATIFWLSVYFQQLSAYRSQTWQPHVFTTKDSLSLEQFIFNK